LTPSLLGLINPNIRQGYDSFAVFEINKTHQKSDGLTDENVPVELDMLSLVITNKDKQSGATYYQAKRSLDYLAESLGLKLVYKKMNEQSTDSLVAPFEYRRSAEVVDESTGLSVGVIGEYKKSVTRNFKLTEYTAGFEINIRKLFEATQDLLNNYKPISKYPSAERDICFKVSQNVSYDQIIDASNSALNGIQMETLILPIDIYQAQNSETKNVTIRIKLTAYDHTMSSEEITKVVEELITSVVVKTQAVII